MTDVATVARKLGEGDIHYCDNGCTTDGHRVTTEAPSRICRRCEDRLHQWLTKIPDLYALAPTFVEHGTVERNPESSTTKAADVPAPMRLDVIDLLDTRRGRRWQGLTPTEDRRGVVGYLKVHLDRLIEERPLTTVKPITTVTKACDLLDRHRLWIAEQDWISELYDDMHTVHRSLSDAVGDYRRPPVGHCHLIPEDRDELCGGPLFANPYGGVRCARCSATWDAAHLRQLGLAQAAAREENAG